MRRARRCKTILLLPLRAERAEYEDEIINRFFIVVFCLCLIAGWISSQLLCSFEYQTPHRLEREVEIVCVSLMVLGGIKHFRNYCLLISVRAQARAHAILILIWWDSSSFNRAFCSLVAGDSSLRFVVVSVVTMRSVASTGILSRFHSRLATNHGSIGGVGEEGDRRHQRRNMDPLFPGSRL